MKAYVLSSMDMMGFPIEEKFFIKKERALEKFNEKVEEYRKNDNLATDEQAAEHNLSSKAITINEKGLLSNIKSAMFCIWYKCSHEYDEWDIAVEHLEISEIEIEE